MKNNIPRSWLYPDSLATAADVQRQLSKRVSLEDSPELLNIRYIGGVDVSNTLYDPENMIHAAMVVLQARSLIFQEASHLSERSEFEYIPGYLAFREVPALVKAYQALAVRPDLIFVDGHGISHPRGLGIASHLGVVLDCPTIGVAKSILVGKPAGELGSEPGDQAPLFWKDRQIGVVLRTKRRTNPLFISPGHKISMESAVAWVMNTLKGYRLPEPTRQAHLEANRVRRSMTSERAHLPLY